MATKIRLKKKYKANILVTGSDGFIGSHLQDLLAMYNYHVYRYDIKVNSTFDINDYASFDAAVKATKPKFIVHLAAVSNRKDVAKNPEQALKTNIIGTFNVLKAAHKYKVKVILASSAATVEPRTSLYAATKSTMEMLATMFDSNVTIARFYNIYGPRSKSVVNKFIYNMKRGRKLILNGNTKRDYMHVLDLCMSLLMIIEAKQQPRFVTIGTGRSVSLNKLVSIIEKEFGRKAEIVRKKPIFEIQESYCDDPYGVYKITLEQGIGGLI